MLDTKIFREQMIARREELSNRLHTIEDMLDEVQNPDAEERATEREQDEVMEAQGNAGLEEIRAIDAALARMDEGTYGICAKCEEPISKERLEAVPYAALCRNCMS